MKQVLFLTLLMALFVTCKKDQLCDCVPPPVDARIDILYKDQSGQSLINSTPEFSDSNIIIFYKKNGFFENAYDAHMSDPEKYSIRKNEKGEIVVSITPSYYYFDGNFSETMVELNPETRDIIRCEFMLSDNGRTCKNVWFNDQKMDSTAFEIIK